MAISLNKKRINALENTKILLSIMKKHQSYSAIELRNILKDKNYTEKEIQSMDITLGWIMDESQNGSLEMPNNYPINYYNFKFKRKAVDLGKKVLPKIDENKQINHMEDTKLELTSNDTIQENVTMKHIQQICENASVPELLDYILYVDPLNAFDKNMVSIAEIDDALKLKYHLSNAKVKACDKYLFQIKSDATADDLEKVSENTFLHYVGDNRQNGKVIIKKVVNDKNYYYEYYVWGGGFEIATNPIQKYFKCLTKGSLSCLQYDSKKEMLYSEYSKMDFLVLAVENFKRGIFESSISYNLRNLLCNEADVKECLFDLDDYTNLKEYCKSKKIIWGTNLCLSTGRGFPIKELSYMVKLNSKIKKKFYGNKLSYNDKMQYIDDLKKEYLYNNMVVLTEYQNEFGEMVYQAIPSRYVVILHNEKEMHLCAMNGDIGGSIEWKFLMAREIYDMETGQMLMHFRDLENGVYDTICLSDICREITSNPKCAVHVKDLKEIINSRYFNNKYNTQKQLIR